jgi:hypothetical protein
MTADAATAYQISVPPGGDVFGDVIRRPLAAQGVPELEIEDQRHRAVVDELDLPTRTETTHVCTGMPSSRRPSENASTSGAACSGEAASVKRGRLPLRMLAEGVNPADSVAGLVLTRRTRSSRRSRRR